MFFFFSFHFFDETVYLIIVPLLDLPLLDRPLYINCTYMLVIDIPCWQAWRALSNLSINNAYLRPGVTRPVDDGGTNGSYSARERSTVKVISSTDGSFYSNSRQNQCPVNVSGTGRSFHSFPSSVPGDDNIVSERFPRVNNQDRESEPSCTHLNGVEKPFTNPVFSAVQLESGEACLDDIDDDDILKVMLLVNVAHRFSLCSTPCKQASFINLVFVVYVDCSIFP